ncbi:hypothetical protein HDU76_013646 [Blyttiomyces sp. JEL0837]|nr:hypothetical protein HDU76_013646 [Blyttiomyces sp. JEL0837]
MLSACLRRTILRCSRHLTTATRTPSLNEKHDFTSDQHQSHDIPSTSVLPSRLNQQAWPKKGILLVQTSSPTTVRHSSPKWQIKALWESFFGKLTTDETPSTIGTCVDRIRSILESEGFFESANDSTQPDLYAELWQCFGMITLEDPSLRCLPREALTIMMQLSFHSPYKSLDQLESIVRAMDRAGISLNDRENYILLEAWKEKGVLDRPDLCIEVALSRCQGLCRILLLEYAARTQKLAVNNLITRTLATFGDSLHTESLSTFFESLADLHSPDAAFSLYRHLQRFLDRRGACLPLNSYQNLLFTLGSAKTFSYSSGTRQYRMNSLKVAEKVFREGLCFYPANEILFNRMLRVAANNNAVDLMERLMSEMISVKLRPSVTILASLLSYHIRQGNLNKAEEMSNKLFRFASEPQQKILWESLLKGFLAARKFGHLFRTLERMKQNGARTSLKTYETLIYHTSKFSSEMGERMLKLARNDGYQPTQRSLHNDTSHKISTIKSSELESGDECFSLLA